MLIYYHGIFLFLRMVYATLLCNNRWINYCFYYAGPSHLHTYATNTLSWTCSVKDVHSAVNKVGSHVISSSMKTPAAADIRE